jgi:hypothetical protein
MLNRRIAMYFAWSRPDEDGAQLGTLDHRFAALFEIRRAYWPQFEHLAGPAIDQGIAGTLDHEVLSNYNVFAERTQAWTGTPLRIDQRIAATRTMLDDAFLSGLDTLIIISLDSLRIRQTAEPREVVAVQSFLSHPDHSVFVCPHHDIGNVGGLSRDQAIKQQEAEMLHHGDRAIPPQQRFGTFGLSLLDGLGVPLRNRFGLRPAREPDGSPSPLDVATGDADRFGMLAGVGTLNLHPHLPHYEPLPEAAGKYDVLARQRIDLTAPPHPFVEAGHDRFDAMLQAKSGVFAGQLVVCDSTLWSSVAGGLASLERLWRNIVQRAHREI